MELDHAMIDRDVQAAIRKFGRARRVQEAVDADVRKRTAEQAAMVALARLIEAGWCV